MRSNNIDLEAEKCFVEFKEVFVEDIYSDEWLGQVRQNSTKNDHVGSLRNSLEQNGLTGELAVCEDFGFKYRIVDGNHRIKAYKEMLEEDPSLPKKVKVAIVKFSSELQKRDFQLKANAHEPALNNSVADVVKGVSLMIDNLEDAGGFESTEVIDSLIQNLVNRNCSGMTPAQKRKVLRELRLGYVSRKAASYSMNEAIQLVSDCPSIPWKADKAKEISNGYCVILVPEIENFIQRIGDTIQKNQANPGLKTVVVVWKRDLGVKDAYDSIDKLRQKVIDGVAVQNSWKHLIDDIYYLGQKMEDGEEPGTIFS